MDLKGMEPVSVIHTKRDEEMPSRKDFELPEGNWRRNREKQQQE